MGNRDIQISEETLLDALEYLCNAQNTDDFSDVTKQRLNNVEKFLSVFNQDTDIAIANELFSLTASANRDGFRQGFKAAISLIQTINQSK